nr:Replication factor C subunit [Pandoravirus aubagnensis]
MEHEMQAEPPTPSPFTTSLVLAPSRPATTTTTMTTTVVSRSGARRVTAVTARSGAADDCVVESPSTQSTTYAGTVQYELPWVEKYRPLVLDDITGNADAIRYLKALAVDGNVPNLLLSVRAPPPRSSLLALVLLSSPFRLSPHSRSHPFVLCRHVCGLFARAPSLVLFSCTSPAGKQTKRRSLKLTGHSQRPTHRAIRDRRVRARRRVSPVWHARCSVRPLTLPSSNSTPRTNGTHQQRSLPGRFFLFFW